MLERFMGGYQLFSSVIPLKTSTLYQKSRRRAVDSFIFAEVLLVCKRFTA